MFEGVTGVVLAGGKSIRMGEDKALLPYKGKTLILNVVETMQTLFTRVLVSVQPNDSLGVLPVDRIVDRYPDSGPMGGISSVLEAGEREIFCVACDMPFLNPKIIEYIAGMKGFDAVIPVWEDRLQVLHALYSQSILNSLHGSIRGGNLKISDVFGTANVRYVSDDELRKIDPSGASFSNLNTPADYQRIRNNEAS